MTGPVDYRSADIENNTRRIPRVDCRIESVSIASGPVTAREIRNISPDGVLARLDGSVSPGDHLDLEFFLPHDDRPIRARCRVVYVIGSRDPSLEAGLVFESIRNVHQARIRSFIEAVFQSQALRRIHESLDGSEPAAGILVETDRAAIDAVLRDAARQQVRFYLLVDGHYIVRTCHIDTLLEDGTIVFRDHSAARCDAGPGTRVFVSFYDEESGFQFSSYIRKSDDASVFVGGPARMYKSDRRANRRTSMDESIPVEITVSPGTTYRGTVVDAGPRGILCRLRVPLDDVDLFRVGVDIAYESSAVSALPRFGVVRHRHIPRSDEVYADLQVGIEVGVRAGVFTKIEIEPEEWETEKAQGIQAAPVDLAARQVLFRNDEGKVIRALLNDGSRGRPATVIVIPPAFGKRKESTAPLAATLLSTFAHYDLPVVTVRYDGINRPGQSHNDGRTDQRGYEMLRYRPTQGIHDIRATLQFVRENAAFSAERVFLVTSSMSSIDARKLLAGASGLVDGWVSLMGVPSAQSTLINVLAGTDIISNYRIGIRSGVRGMLGHFVNMDTLARDLIEHNYAFVTDARSDMGSIDVPVFWIRGRYDRWVQAEEVEDILTVGSRAPRRLIDIPTGHNLHNSEDAREAYRRIAEFLLEMVTGSSGVRGLLPDQDALVAMITAEREAVMKPLDATDIENYWESYLIGDGREGSGYDFYANLPEFRVFLDDQAVLLDPTPGMRLLDAGCGTGLVTERLIRRSLDRMAGGPPENTDGPITIDSVDLVPDALDRARARCDVFLDHDRAGDAVLVRFSQVDLDPPISDPIADFIAHPDLPVSFLAERIPGISTRTIRMIESCGIPLLGDFLRGNELPETIAGMIEQRLDEDARAGVQTVRSAAREVRTRGPLPGAMADPPYDGIVASLLLSYIRNPDYLLYRFHTMLVPGGRLVLSSMRPDSDVSMIFTDYIRSVRSSDPGSETISAAREMLNEAASLFELEEEGYFRFYSARELEDLCASVGFRDVRSRQSLGDPPQATIVDCVATGSPVPVWMRYA